MTDIKKYEPLWGTWYIDSLLGEGGFGKVYKVRREEFGKTYYSAVKIISIPHDEGEIRQMRNDGLDHESMQSFLYAFVTDIVSEIDLMRQFRGTNNIVSLEDHQIIEKKDGIGWDILIRMELLTSLSDYAAQTPLSTADVVKLGIHICRALELCAQRNTIHRDIKPDNIFMSPHGEYKLGDFGIARQLERTSSGLSKKGTYTYMAPEVFRGEQYGSSVDTYSLGIVLYRFLNHNRTPFLPDFPHPIMPSDRDEALAKRLSGIPMPLLKDVSLELSVIVLKACAFNRQGRFTSPTEMREALEGIEKTQNYEAAITEAPQRPSAPILDQTYAIPGQAQNSMSSTANQSHTPPTPGQSYTPPMPEQRYEPPAQGQNYGFPGQYQNQNYPIPPEPMPQSSAQVPYVNPSGISKPGFMNYTQGSKLLMVSGILLIVFGSISSLIYLLYLIILSGLSTVSVSNVMTFLLGLISGGLGIFVGIIGRKYCNVPEKAQLCLSVVLVLLAFLVLDSTYSLIATSIDDVSEISIILIIIEGIVQLVIPVLFLLGALKNKKTSAPY
ncbi:MAG: serine/threonine protein kinase [Peptococcaceae bacterium]|nr:serine/threonine protein kinase [Peptococcaceae bacterium]